MAMGDVIGLLNMIQGMRQGNPAEDARVLQGYQSREDMFANSPQTPPDQRIRDAYKNLYGVDYPTVNDPVTGEQIPATMRTAEQLKLRQARQTGQATGETAIGALTRQPEINDMRLNELERLTPDVQAFSRVYPNLEIAGGVSGFKENKPTAPDLPNTVESVIARDPNMPLSEKLLKLGEISKMKQRESAAGQPKTLEALLVEAIREGRDPAPILRRMQEANAARATETPEEKERRRIEEQIMQITGRLDNTQAGVNIVPELSPGRDPVIQNQQSQLEALLNAYEAVGGNRSKFGRGGKPQAASPYKSADEVKAAYKAGKLGKDQAAQILRNQFGMQ